jgi:hypothetical protein
MIASRGYFPQALARCLTAAGVLASAAAILPGRAAHSQGPTLGWSPSREEAIVLEQPTPAILNSDESVVSPPRVMRRPSGPARPSAAWQRTYFTDASRGESLPSVTGTPITPDQLPVPGEMYYDEQGGAVLPPDGSYDGQPFCDPCGPGALSRWGGWGACAWIPVCIFIPRPPLDGLELFGGVQGFTGPANRGASGSFGFHEGFNWGLPIGGLVSFQWGTNWTQNNFDGSFATPDERNQIFFTAGLYRRVDWGLQGGLVVDYLHDEWDYSADLTQLRGELSWLWCGCNELGFWFTAGVNDSSGLSLRLPAVDGGGTVRFVDTTATLAVNDLYAFFFRRQFACGGEGRLFAGFTGHAQGLVGGDAVLPLNDRWSLRSNFIYAGPGGDDNATDPAFTREAWNVGISLVWTPCPRSAAGQNYNRPLFPVADNGSFLTRLVR